MNKKDYKRVMDGIRPDQALKSIIGEKVMKKPHPVFNGKAILTAAACLAIIALLVVGIPLLSFSPGGGQKTLQLFVTTAYAAGANQPSNPKAVELKPDVKTVIGAYSPAMNSVPGFPFYAECAGADKIVITTDSGALLLWGDASTSYALDSKGKQYAAKPSEKIYWSVIDISDNSQSNIPADKAILTFTAYKGSKELGSQQILISQGDNFMYTAEYMK